jgi:class 3 adenylate cyclase
VSAILRFVVVCAVCGNPLDGSPKFCPECGTRIEEARAVTEERKTVTALFCDLVGFTGLAEGADPEDVDRMLTGYFATARTAIEAFGGVVEKFIGDAVVGVFGVPASHEDDPERAVRAGLRIAEQASGLVSLERLKTSTRGEPHMRNIDRWSELVSSGDIRGIRRVMTGLDTDSVQMREVSPFGGLLPEDERRRVLMEVRR